MKINREELLKVLNSVRPGLAAREIVEQSTSFVFTEGLVMTYNDEIAVSHPIEVDIEGAVKAQELLDLLNKMKEEEISLETEENQILIKGKRSEAGIAYASEISLPIEEVESEKTWIKLPAPWDNGGLKSYPFTEAIRDCLFSVAKSMARPELACIHVTPNHIESSDGFRLTRYDIELSKGFKNGVLIPGRACAVLVDHKPLKVALSKGWIHFLNSAGATLSCRTLKSDYIDLGPFLEVEGPEIDIDGDAIIPILDKASIFADEKAGNDIEVTIADNWTTIKGEGASGWFKEKTRTKYKGEQIQFMIAPKFLIDILQVVETIVIGTREGQEDQKLLKFVTDSVVHCCATYNAKKEE